MSTLAISNAESATPTLSRWLALGAIVGPLLFTLAWIALGVLQPPVTNMYGVMGGVSGAISNPISGLGVGPHAELFNAAFIVCGILSLAGVVGVFQVIRAPERPVARWSAAALLALSPLGLALAGVYTLAVSIGLHLFAAMLLFMAPVVAFVVAGRYLRHVREWRRLGGWLLLASPLTLILFVAYAASFNQAAVAAGHGIAGLTERIMLFEVQAWYVAMGWRAFRVPRASPTAR